MLIDSFERTIDYLRISLTDRCNLRCVYCLPERNIDWIKRNNLLSMDEIVRVVDAAASLGVSKVRLTGGEPLVRPDVLDIVRRIAATPGIGEVSIATNAMLLEKMAVPLAEAGLTRVNVSLDTLDPEKFHRITRFGDINCIWRGLQAAEDAGLEPIKINTVVVHGLNDDELIALARLSIENPWHIRFIELMPVGNQQSWGVGFPDVDRYFSIREMRERLVPLNLQPDSAPMGNGPACTLRIPHALGTVGFISPVGEHFCKHCNRLRLTADGCLRACLLLDREIPVRDALHSGGDLKALLQTATKQKPRGHELELNHRPKRAAWRRSVDDTILPMKLLLVFPPFHTPASPPFGLAYLKGALSQSNPNVTVRVQDWNLAFFKRWLMGEMPDICNLHPRQMLGQVCPSSLVAQGRGNSIWQALNRIPGTEAEQMDYMRAAKGLDDIFNALGAVYNEILLPFIEQRVDLGDAAIERLFSVELAQVEVEAPDMIGFSILSEYNLLYALALGRVIKAQFDIPILLGGAMMAHLEAEELLMGFPWLDLVFSGEAEGSLGEFLSAWPNGDLESIAGLTHCIGTQACYHGQLAQLDLTTLPDPDFSDYDLDGYLAPEPVLPIITSRGCYWGKCTFCSHTLPYGGGVRVRNPDDVIAEMKHQMERYGVGNFLFVDEAISPRMLRHLSEGILSNGLDVRFGAEGIRVEEAFDANLLQTAHEAGLRWIYVGIESSIQRLLDLIEKGIKIEDIERLIETCCEIGIVPQLSFIVGLPTTTSEEMQREIEFMQHHAVDSSTFVLLYGSPMYARPDLFGIRIEERETLYITPHGPIHSPRFHFSVAKGLSPLEADWKVESVSKDERMRPHLGEVHATLLAESGFFNSASRPDDLPAPAQVAIQSLQADSATKGTGYWYMHMISAMEAEGRYQEAMTIAQSALGVVEPEQRAGLYLHIAAILNYAGQHKPALEVLSRIEGEHTVRTAALGEKLRALFALGDVMNTAKTAEALHGLGYEVPMSYAMLGFAYEQLGRYKKAIESLTRAEHRQYLTPELDDALARCYGRLKQSELARKRREKEARKRRHLGDLNPSTGTAG